MKTKAVSVRLQSLSLNRSGISYTATDFNGNADIIPASQVFGLDYEVQKSEAYWISEWILSKKNLTYSDKKIAWFNQETKILEPNIAIKIEKHIPERKEPITINPDANLIR